MPVANLNPTYLAPFNGRNGKDNPIFLGDKNQEQINIHSTRGWLESRAGEALYLSFGNTIPDGLGSWGDNVITSYDGGLYMEGNVFKTGLTAGNPTTFLEYYGDLYISNGKDDVQMAIRTTTSSSITALSTSIPCVDPTKFLNDVGKVYIDGDEIDYVGISTSTRATKTANYTTTNTDSTINVNATGGAITITLVTAVGNAGVIHIIRKTDSSVNAVTVDPNGTQTIDLGDTAGATTTKTLASQGDCIVIRSDGANWVITTLIQANATVIDNVTNIASTHDSGSYVIQTQAQPNFPKGRALAEYGRKMWACKISSDFGAKEPRFLYYSASSNDKNPELIREFRTNIVERLQEAEDFSIQDTTVTTNYTITSFDNRTLVNASGGNRTVTLPSAVGNTDLVLVIKKIDATAFTVTVDGAGAETIDGIANVVLSVQNASIVVRSDGANWVTTSYQETGSSREFFGFGDTLSAVVNYRSHLIVSKKDEVKYISGFLDAGTGTLPVPNVENFYKEDGAINEDCMKVVNEDVIYFSGKRIRRLFAQDDQGFSLDDSFDRPVQDVLARLDPDQSEASMIYSKEKDLLLISVKSRGSRYNDMRICFSTATASWWLEDRTFCRKYITLNGEIYYTSSITGRVMKEYTGATRNGYSDITYFRSKEVKPVPFGRQDWRHLVLEGSIIQNTIVEVCVYVDSIMVFCATIDNEDILTPPPYPQSEAIGNVVFGNQTYGGSGGTIYTGETDIQKQFKKWIPIGLKGFSFYYTIRSSGTAYGYRIKSAQVNFVPIVEPSRLQSSS